MRIKSSSTAHTGYLLIRLQGPELTSEDFFLSLTSLHCLPDPTVQALRRQDKWTNQRFILLLRAALDFKWSLPDIHIRRNPHSTDGEPELIHTDQLQKVRTVFGVEQLNSKRKKSESG